MLDVYLCFIKGCVLMFWVDWIAYELPPTLQLQFLEEPNTEVLSCGPPPGRTSVTIIHFLQCAPCPHGRGMWFNACSPPTSVILQLFILFASRRRAFQEHHVLLGMLNVSLQLTFSLMQRLGISFLYVYYVKTVYMYIYILWNNGWAVARKDMFNASRRFRISCFVLH